LEGLDLSLQRVTLRQKLWRVLRSSWRSQLGSFLSRPKGSKLHLDSKPRGSSSETFRSRTLWRRWIGDGESMPLARLSFPYFVCNTDSFLLSKLMYFLFLVGVACSGPDPRIWVTPIRRAACPDTLPSLFAPNRVAEIYPLTRDRMCSPWRFCWLCRASSPRNHWTFPEKEVLIGFFETEGGGRYHDTEKGKAKKMPFG